MVTGGQSGLPIKLIHFGMCFSPLVSVPRPAGQIGCAKATVNLLQIKRNRFAQNTLVRVNFSASFGGIRIDVCKFDFLEFTIKNAQKSIGLVRTGDVVTEKIYC